MRKRTKKREDRNVDGMVDDTTDTTDDNYPAEPNRSQLVIPIPPNLPTFLSKIQIHDSTSVEKYCTT